MPRKEGGFDRDETCLANPRPSQDDLEKRSEQSGMRNLRGCCDSCQTFAKESMLRIPRPCAAVVAAATFLGGQGFAMAIVLAPVACKSHASDLMGITGLFLDRSSPGFSVSRSCRPPACSPGFIISGSSFCLAILHKFISFRKSTPFSQGADPH